MKDQYRQRVRRELQALSQQDIDQRSLALSRNLSHYLKLNFSSDVVVGAFIPFGQEPRWMSAFETNSEIAVPVISAESMVFAKCPLDFVIKNVGNYEAGKELICEDGLVPDLLLVPGLAFTRAGDRLGRGKGYYDRYLLNFTGLKLGLCYEEQIFNEVPTDKWDRQVDQIITDKGIYNG